MNAETNVALHNAEITSYNTGLCHFIQVSFWNKSSQQFHFLNLIFTCTHLSQWVAYFTAAFFF